MSVKSMFDFKFPVNVQQEGLSLCHQIGHDMVTLDGYVSHEVLQDVKDPGHIMVNTEWSSPEACTAVLSKYQHGRHVTHATALIGSEPTGFVAAVLD